MATVYTIRGWDALYETNETRKLKRLSWVPTPIKHDGNGYRRLMAMPDAGNLFAAFRLTVEVAAKMPKRGTLVGDQGPITPEDLSFRTGLPEAFFVKMLDVCSNPKFRICWIDATNDGVNLPESAGVPADAGRSRARARTEQNRIEQKGTDKDTHGAQAPVAGTPATPAGPIAEVVASWNALAKANGLPEVKSTKGDRTKKIQTRLRDGFWAENWRAAIGRIPNSPFLLGHSEGGWRADFDWFLRPNSVAKVIEGKYENGSGPGEHLDDTEHRIREAEKRVYGKKEPA